MIRGQIVHRTIKQFHTNFNNNKKHISSMDVLQQLLEIFEILWGKAKVSINYLGLSKAKTEQFYQATQIMLLNYSDWFSRTNMKIPDISEKRIQSKKYHALGIIDSVYKSHGSIVLVDYKTSQKPTITKDIFRQAAIYALLYADAYKKTPDLVNIHFVKISGDPIPIHVDEHLLEYAKILITSVRENTTSLNEKDYPCKCKGQCLKDFNKNGTNRRKVKAA